MKRIALASLVVAVVAAVAMLTTAQAATPVLKGEVGPGFTIEVKKAGKKVKTLKAGKYKFVISDKSSFHNYTIEREKPSKPHIEKHATSTSGTGMKTFTMTLKPGSWRAYCSVHEAQMHIDFKVTR